MSLEKEIEGNAMVRDLFVCRDIWNEMAPLHQTNDPNHAAKLLVKTGDKRGVDALKRYYKYHQKYTSFYQPNRLQKKLDKLERLNSLILKQIGEFIGT